MHDSALVTAFPLLVRHGFLDPQACRRIREAMDAGVEEAAEVIGDQITREQTVRRARSIEVDEQTLAFVEGRTEDLRPEVTGMMGQRLGSREGTGFLRYRPGDFYRPHRDRGVVSGWPAAARRLVTVVVFLNGGTGSGGLPELQGGELTLYSPVNRAPVEISPETGLLVAFPSSVLHEVRMIGRGTRDVAVDWFYEPDSNL